MAKSSAVAKNEKRIKLVKKFANKRAKLIAIIKNKNTSMEDRMEAQFALQSLPRDSSRIRVRNRCGLTGRPRGVYRKFKLSRIALRELGSDGKIPGIIKSSW